MENTAYETMMKYLQITAEAAGFSNPRSLPEIIGALIGTALSFVGIIFLMLIIYAGFLWMTSAGNDEKVLAAKKVLTNATIGLIIIVASYSITRFVFEALTSASQ
jgi:hypothetical protein